MGRNHWNAQAYHRRHLHRPLHRRIPVRGLVTFGIFAILLAATAAVAVAEQSTHSLPPDQMGICRATGIAERPFVFVVVDRATAANETRPHAGDIIDVQSPADCGIHEEPQSANGPACATNSSSAAVEAAQPVNRTAAADNTSAPANTTSAEPSPSANATAKSSAPAPENTTGNASEPNTTGAPSNSSAPPPTSSAPARSPLCDGDVAVTNNGSTEGNEFVFRVHVDSLGPGVARHVQLADRLPDLGSEWNVSGPDASHCAITGRDLRCDLGNLHSGQGADLELRALHCPEDCGEDVNDTAIVHARNDRDASNDRASASIAIKDCPADDWSWANETSPSASPAPSSSAAPSNDSGANSTPSPNSTAPTNSTSPAAGNHTGNGSANASTTAAPAPKGDLNVSQHAQQDAQEVRLLIRVLNQGAGPATRVTLADTLPDLHRSWYLGGDAADQCTLDGRYLNCRLDDLASGANTTLEVRAYTDRMPCGDHATNTVVGHAEDDADASNDRATASILAPAC